MSPRKAAFRILTWETGSFELEPRPTKKSVLEEISDSTEGLLMEGMRHLDEMKRLEGDLPPMSSEIGLTNPLTAPLRDLTQPELDTLQLVINHGRVSTVLDRSSGTDLDTATVLVALIKKSCTSRHYAR